MPGLESRDVVSGWCPRRALNCAKSVVWTRSGPCGDAVGLRPGVDSDYTTAQPACTSEGLMPPGGGHRLFIGSDRDSTGLAEFWRDSEPVKHVAAQANIGTSDCY